MEEEIKLQEAVMKKEPSLEEKLQKIIEARDTFLKEVFEGGELEEGYDTTSYNRQQEDLGLSEGKLLNIGNGGLFINWNNFFAKMRGDNSEEGKGKRTPYTSYEENWYTSYAGVRPCNKGGEKKIVPKWEVVVDKTSEEKFTHYLFQGSCLYQQDAKEFHYRHNGYYSGNNEDNGDIVKINRPLTLFFDDRGVPQMYVFSLSGSSKEVMANKQDENFMIRADDYEVDYFNNLFLLVGGIFYSSPKNRRILRKIAKRTGASTFSSLIAALSEKKTEDFYGAFWIFNEKFLELKTKLEDKKGFLDKYINLMFVASKTFRNDKRVRFRVNAKNKSFVPFSLDSEYSLGEVRNYIPAEVTIRGEEAVCRYKGGITKKEYFPYIRNDITPTRKKFFEEFSKISEENAREIINRSYKNIEMYQSIAYEIKKIAEDLNNFSNFVCKAFSTTLFLNISDK